MSLGMSQRVSPWLSSCRKKRLYNMISKASFNSMQMRMFPGLSAFAVWEEWKTNHPEKKKKQEALLEKIQLRVQLCGTDAECSKNLVPSNSGGWRDESGLRGWRRRDVFAL